MALPYKYFTANVSDLLLDVKNPRFASSTLVDNASKIPDQNDVINHLLKYADIITLAYNIERTRCLHGSEMVTCYADQGGNLIVAEGNRRICACKLLLNRDLIPDEYTASFPEASPETIENITAITINLYPNRESVQAYLSDRHISGVRKWSALEKNNYYMNLFQQYGDIHIVKSFTTDSLATVKKCIIKYQFFMRVFKVLAKNGVKLEIEKIDYLPLADRFMDILVGDDSDVGLSLKLDENKFAYLCPDNKKELYDKILYLIGEAFLVRKTTDVNPRIVGTDVPNKTVRKNLILEDKRIPGLYDLIKEYKAIDNGEATYTEDEPDDTPAPTTQPNEDDFSIFAPDKYIPEKQREDALMITVSEAKDFNFGNRDYDKKILEILRELATMRISQKPVACACLFRCLLEICARRVFDKNIDPSTKTYDEKDLKGNLLYINNNVLFNNLKGSLADKTRTAIKDKLKDGLIDVLNLYIHYPQMVDVSQLLNSWRVMKLFVIRCLSI